MYKSTLAMLFLLFSIPALAVPSTTCNSCTSLRDFGSFGAAQIYRTTGGFGPAVGADKVWVNNTDTGQSAFVDVDTPGIRIGSLGGIYLPIPDVTKTEINATWADGSATEIWIVPNEVMGAIAEGIERAEQHGPGNEVTPREARNLPGFSDIPFNFDRILLGVIGRGTFSTSTWVFAATTTVYGNPVVTVHECAWSDVC